MRGTRVALAPRMKIRTVLLVSAVFSTAIACSSAGSQRGDDESARKSEPLTMCFYDGGPCIDADIPDPSTMFEAGAPAPPPPVFPDPDAGFGGAAFFCGLDPKYVTEYTTALMTGAFKSCMLGCGAGECCYAGIACVAQ